HRIAIRSPLFADLQRFSYPDPARLKLPNPIVYSAPVEIEDYCLGTILAPIRGPGRDLLIVDVDDDGCDRLSEVSGQIILNLVRPAIANADGSRINHLRRAGPRPTEHDSETNPNHLPYHLNQPHLAPLMRVRGRQGPCYCREGNGSGSGTSSPDDRRPDSIPGKGTGSMSSGATVFGNNPSAPPYASPARDPQFGSYRSCGPND